MPLLAKVADGAEPRRDVKSSRPLPPPPVSVSGYSSDSARPRGKPGALDNNARSSSTKPSRERLTSERPLTSSQRADHRYEDAVRKYTSKIHSLEEQLTEAQKRSDRLEQLAAHEQAQFRSLRKKYVTLRSTLEQKEALYAAQSAELRTAQTYLNTTDSVPGTRVIDAIHYLNSEIRAAAAMVADSFQFSSSNLDHDSQVAAASTLTYPGGIGEHLLYALSDCDNTNDPILVQTAIQALLVSESERCISSVCPHNDTVDNIVKRLHGLVRQKEVQAVSGRWRALSARHIRLYSPDPSNSGEAMVAALFHPLTALVMIAGCVSSPKEIENIAMPKFASKLRTVLSQALSLGRLIHEEITSTDYEVVYIPPNTPFDPDTADDEYAEKTLPPDSNQPILCTLELGLRQVTIIQPPASNSSQSDAAQQVEKILVKPRIALESAVEKMFG